MQPHTTPTRRRSARSLLAMALGLGLVAAISAPAMAAQPTVTSRNVEFSVLDEIDTESCPGLTIEVDLTGVRNRTEYYDNEGNLIREIINVRYWFTFTNVDDPSLVVKSPGHRHITFDYVNDLFTDTGVYRSGTMPGAGNVLLVAGRVVSTLETEELISATPHAVEFLGEFCEALAG